MLIRLRTDRCMEILRVDDHPLSHRVPVEPLPVSDAGHDGVPSDLRCNGSAKFLWYHSHALCSYPVERRYPFVACPG